MKLTDSVIRAFKPAKIFRDNMDKINYLDYSSSGDTLVTSSDDDSIVIYDCFDGKQKKTANSKKYGVAFIQFTHASNTVIHTSTKVDASLMSDVEAQEHYDTFFEDVFLELEEKYGEIEEMNVCDNLGDHLVGNVYVKFRFEEDAEKAVNDVNNRWYNGAPIYAELSPVTDFRESCCRQYEMGECTRGGFCNFMHLKPISRELRRRLYGRRRGGAGVGGGASSGPLVRRGRSRSFSPASPRRRSRSRSPRHRRRRSRSRSR